MTGKMSEGRERAKSGHSQSVRTTEPEIIRLKEHQKAAFQIISKAMDIDEADKKSASAGEFVA